MLVSNGSSTDRSCTAHERFMQRFGSATPRVRHSQDLLLPGSATPRVHHSQGPQLPGSATSRVSHYIRYPNILSIQLLFQQIVIFYSNFYLHYDFSSISLPLTLWYFNTYLGRILARESSFFFPS